MYNVPLGLLARMYTHGCFMVVAGGDVSVAGTRVLWIPAFAGMTKQGVTKLGCQSAFRKINGGREQGSIPLL